MRSLVARLPRLLRLPVPRVPLPVAVVGLCVLGGAMSGWLPGAVVAIAVVALTGTSPERWPGLVAAAFVGGTLGAVLAGGAPMTSLLGAAARTVEALAAADMLRWYARGAAFRFAGGRAITAFGVVAVVAPALGALLGKGLLELNGTTMSAAGWWRADVLGIVVAGLVVAMREARLEVRRMARERDAADVAQRAALLELVRVLEILRETRQVLPVCGQCGDFREDVSYWLSLDTYRVEHAAALSHAGACPRCAERGDRLQRVDWNAVFGVRRTA